MKSVLKRECLVGLAALVLSATSFGFPTKVGMRFVQDDRPVDGFFLELNLVRNPNKAGEALTYTVDFRKAGYDRPKHTSFDETTNLGKEMTCSFETEDITCSQDLRPVDGVFTELTLTANEQNEYTAILRKTWVDRRTGKPGEKEETLATRLILKRPS